MITFTRRESVSPAKRGAALVEYGLILGLIALVALGAVNALGPKVAGVFETADSAVANSTTGTGGEGGEPSGLEATPFQVGWANYAVNDLGDGTAYVTYTATGTPYTTAFEIFDSYYHTSSYDASGETTVPCGTTIDLQGIFEIEGWGSWWGVGRVYKVDCVTQTLSLYASTTLAVDLTDDGTNMTVSVTASTFGPNPAGFYAFNVESAGGSLWDESLGASATATFTVPCAEMEASTVIVAGAAFEDSSYNGPMGYEHAILPQCAG